MSDYDTVLRRPVETATHCGHFDIYVYTQQFRVRMRLQESIIFSFLMLGLVSTTFGEERVSLIGKIVSKEQRYSEARLYVPGSYIGNIKVEVVKILKMPKYVQKTWLKTVDGKSTLNMRYKSSKKEEWINVKGAQEFNLYTLEHTTDFGVLSVDAAYPCSSTAENEKYTLAQTKRLMFKLSKSNDLACHKVTIDYLEHSDSSIRIHAALILSDKKVLPDLVIPALINSFATPNGEEGAEYGNAVVNYGEAALPYLMKAKNHPSWYVQERVCDSLMSLKNIKDYSWRNKCNTAARAK